jgi:hypothetical protein
VSQFQVYQDSCHAGDVLLQFGVSIVVGSFAGSLAFLSFPLSGAGLTVDSAVYYFNRFCKGGELKFVAPLESPSAHLSHKADIQEAGEQVGCFSNTLATDGLLIGNSSQAEFVFQLDFCDLERTAAGDDLTHTDGKSNLDSGEVDNNVDEFIADVWDIGILSGLGFSQQVQNSVNNQAFLIVDLVLLYNLTQSGPLVELSIGQLPALEQIDQHNIQN